MTRERGFTLVEALIAFAIMAVASVAIYEAIDAGLSAFDRTARIEEAALIAESRLDALRARRKPIAAPFESAVAGTPFRWRIEPLPSPEAEALRASPLRLQQVRLSVRWRDSRAAREIVVERTLLVEREAAR